MNWYDPKPVEPPQHDRHIKQFWADQLQTELRTTCYESADGYYAAKDQLRRIRAELAGKTESQYDPMGFWFGHQSN